MHRYAPVFGTGRALLAVSATAFGFAHLIFGNALSVVLTLVGGWQFARRYQRTGSLLAASVEHAIYGLLVFTAGLGQFTTAPDRWCHAGLPIASPGKRTEA
jgi:uncharacterized protein